MADADTDSHVPLSLMTLALNSRHPLRDAVRNHSTLCPTAHPSPSYISDIRCPTLDFRCPISDALGLELVNLQNLLILLDHWHEERRDKSANVDAWREKRRRGRWARMPRAALGRCDSILHCNLGSVSHPVAASCRTSCDSHAMKPPCSRALMPSSTLPSWRHGLAVSLTMSGRSCRRNPQV